MNCDCYDKAFRPVIRLLEEVTGIMYYSTPDYELHQQRLHDIIVEMNTTFRCIDECWKKVEEE